MRLKDIKIEIKRHDASGCSQHLRVLHSESIRLSLLSFESQTINQTARDSFLQENSRLLVAPIHNIAALHP